MHVALDRVVNAPLLGPSDVFQMNARGGVPSGGYEGRSSRGTSELLTDASVTSLSPALVT